MTADLYPVAGAKIYIGGVLSTKTADFAVADFSAQSWTAIDGWESMGASGDATATITTALINRNRDVKQKGTRNAGQMQNNFAVLPTDAGQIALIAASQTAYNYAFKVVFNDAPAVLSSAVTMTIATPGVLTWTGNPLSNGDAVQLSTTGALPTGLVAATTYYVVAKSGDTFSLAATPGGPAIATSGSQSGTHTASTVTTGTTRYFVALVMNANEQGGAANTTRLMQSSLEINSNIVVVPASQ